MSWPSHQLTFDARWHDYAGALRWLHLAEELNITLPQPYVKKRKRWSRAANNA